MARTLILDSSILIFDDSLSAVDTETDNAIRQALSEHSKGVTTFIISLGSLPYPKQILYL